MTLHGDAEPTHSAGGLRGQMSQHWLLAGLLLSSAAAYFWPQDRFLDPFLLSSASLRWLVVITMFCLGLSIRLDELKELAENPLAVLIGVVVQCTWMPLLAWVAVQTLQLETGLAQGVVLVGCVPGAMASNVLTMSARGNVSYSISLTTVATLLSPISVPLAIYCVGGITNEEVRLDPWQQSKVLLLTVVVPVLVGFTVKLLMPRFTKMRSWVSLVAGLALLWIIASVVAANRDRLAGIESAMLVSLLAINLFGYLGGYAAGKLLAIPNGMRRALCLEVGMQNAGLGTFLAVELFGETTLAQIPTAAYTFGCMLTGTVLSSYWAAYASSEGDNDALVGEDMEAGS